MPDLAGRPASVDARSASEFGPGLPGPNGVLGPRPLRQAQACALARARASRAAARWSALRSSVLRSMHSLHRSSLGSMRPHVSVSGGHSGPGHGHQASSAGRALSIAVLVDGSLDAAGLAVVLTCVLHAFPGARAVIARKRRILTNPDRRGFRSGPEIVIQRARSRSALGVDRDLLRSPSRPDHDLPRAAVPLPASLVSGDRDLRLLSRSR